MSGSDRQDLFVLVADADIENVIKGLLTRPRDLRIRCPRFSVERHPRRDSGCRTEAVAWLRPMLRRFSHALVVFDRHGCGSLKTRERIQSKLEEELYRNGWQEGEAKKAKVIVIDPELEAWAWGDRKALPAAMGWKGDAARVRKWLGEQGLWPRDRSKPPDPKTAMQKTMGHFHAPQSPAKYGKLAVRAELRTCRDPAFNELRQTLRDWFPLPG